MPELPEVETIRSGLAPLLQGRTINNTFCYREGLRYPFPDFSLLHGVQLNRVERRAKYLVFKTNSPWLLTWHLGMTGQFHVIDASSSRATHEHARLILDNGMALSYRDARRFGYAGILQSHAWQSHPWFARLGIEPLSECFTKDVLYAATHQRKAPIKHVIMDASVVVGVGNIYASEALFRAAIRPQCAARRLGRDRIKRLVEAIRQVLQEAILAGGSTISDFTHVDGKPGYFAHHFQVYARQGKPCLRCAMPIKKIVQSGRSSFYCSHCQH